MNTIGPILTLPWGPIILTVIGILIMILVGEILWRTMPHYPEDDEPFDPNDYFEIQEEDWTKK